ncbi:MAG TPA: S4 domain-containing protein [Candidatus Binatia bacterium]|jgi:ribosome-associated heat shock protein Hsp15
MEDRGEPIRIDKWLWAARFFKTRSLAAEAVSGGKVEVGGARAKPSRLVRRGDQIMVRKGLYEWIVVVQELVDQRGPASAAQQMYAETDESRRKREATAAQLRLERPPEFNAPRRPSKKDRRAIHRLTRKGW